MKDEVPGHEHDERRERCGVQPWQQGRRAPLSAFIEGFSLHAATRVLASDRRGLWRLCAYGARGAVASSRLTELPDGCFAYQY